MSELVHIYRNETVEDIHMGRICVVNEQGEMILHAGDSQAITFFRSSSKPIQALPVLKRKLHEKYNLTSKEIAIMAASHTGEPMHLETILSMLQKAGYSEEDFIMLPAYPGYTPARDEMIKQDLPARKALHNCSGKHAGAMMLAEANGDDHKNYWQPECKTQQEILKIIAEMSEYPLEQIKTGVDGCGIVVFAVPLQNIAIAYMHLACPDTVKDPSTREAIELLTACMHEHPLMIRGTGYLCSIFNEDPNVVAKGGANGVYGFGLKKERLGISLKLEDGTEDMWPIVIAEILRQLHYDNLETIKKLDQLKPNFLVNDNQKNVGRIQTVFQLS